MIKKTIENFSLAQIAASGQCFRMDEEPDGSFRIIAGDKLLTARQEENRVEFDCSDHNFESFWRNYFDLDEDYGRFISAVDEKDCFLAGAVKKGSGIRILKQDLWETIVSFLISQQNNITRIKKCINNISEKYGKKMTAENGKEYFAFPEPEAMAGLPEDALMECNLGYRSKYVVRTSKLVASGDFPLDELKTLGYEESRERLLGLYGVGKKVAECICLFSLHHIGAFPIDTHIKQVIDREYGGCFPLERYDGFAGVIQQYIFFNELEK